MYEQEVNKLQTAFTVISTVTNNITDLCMYSRVHSAPTGYCILNMKKDANRTIVAWHPFDPA